MMPIDYLLLFLFFMLGLYLGILLVSSYLKKRRLKKTIVANSNNDTKYKSLEEYNFKYKNIKDD